MVPKSETIQDGDVSEEDEIFKSLSHKIRRDIIKLLGDQKGLSFTEIKNGIGTIDSPSISYHLKSLRYLLKQEKNLYKLTEIGKSALHLMDKIDQSDRFKRNKKKFLWANIVTIICWASMQFFIPFSLSNYPVENVLIYIIVCMNVIPQINYVIIFNLWGRTWKTSKKKADN
jgi:DNA-binding transcriptional ArsR family regulator